MKRKRYIKCDMCGSKIYLGSTAYETDGRCGKYCSADCYVKAYAITVYVDEETANLSYSTIYEE